MNSPSFEHLARLYVVGALDAEELEEFERLRMEGGEEAERFLEECERLSEAFALSLRPSVPSLSTKQRLFERIRAVDSGIREMADEAEQSV